ncbi:myb-like protein X [Anoplophora glabripennis]|uniref:myb-like protein X n=1 Tax=Anoplophora glabripennis TaxID=217634 RepID=UPI0008749786|nr:myb-like protein X [Anoplophora glabripennis]
MTVLKMFGLFIFLIVFSDTGAQITEPASAQSTIPEDPDGKALSGHSSENISHINSDKLNGHFESETLEVLPNRYEKSAEDYSAEASYDSTTVSENSQPSDILFDLLSSTDRDSYDEGTTTKDLTDGFEHQDVINESATSGNFAAASGEYSSEIAAKENETVTENYSVDDYEDSNDGTTEEDIFSASDFEGEDDKTLFGSNDSFDDDLSKQEDITTISYSSTILNEIEQLFTKSTSSSSHIDVAENDSNWEHTSDVKLNREYTKEVEKNESEMPTEATKESGDTTPSYGTTSQLPEIIKSVISPQLYDTVIASDIDGTTVNSEFSMTENNEIKNNSEDVTTFNHESTLLRKIQEPFTKSSLESSFDIGLKQNDSDWAYVSTVNKNGKDVEEDENNFGRETFTESTKDAENNNIEITPNYFGTTSQLPETLESLISLQLNDTVIGSGTDTAIDNKEFSTKANDEFKHTSEDVTSYSYESTLSEEIQEQFTSEPSFYIDIDKNSNDWEYVSNVTKSTDINEDENNSDGEISTEATKMWGDNKIDLTHSYYGSTPQLPESFEHAISPQLNDTVFESGIDTATLKENDEVSADVTTVPYRHESTLWKDIQELFKKSSSEATSQKIDISSKYGIQTTGSIEYLDTLDTTVKSLTKNTKEVNTSKIYKNIEVTDIPAEVTEEIGESADENITASLADTHNVYRKSSAEYEYSDKQNESDSVESTIVNFSKFLTRDLTLSTVQEADNGLTTDINFYRNSETDNQKNADALNFDEYTTQQSINFSTINVVYQDNSEEAMESTEDYNTETTVNNEYAIKTLEETNTNLSLTAEGGDQNLENEPIILDSINKEESLENTTLINEETLNHFTDNFRDDTTEEITTTTVADSGAHHDEYFYKNHETTITTEYSVTVFNESNEHILTTSKGNNLSGEEENDIPIKAKEGDEKFSEEVVESTTEIYKETTTTSFYEASSNGYNYNEKEESESVEGTLILIKKEITVNFKDSTTEEIMSTTEIDSNAEGNFSKDYEIKEATSYEKSTSVSTEEETATTEIDNKTLNDTENNTAKENNGSTEVSEDSEVFSEDNSEEINELTSRRTETFAYFGYSDETIVSNEETVTASTENSEGILTTIKDYLIEISGEDNPLHNSTDKENDTDKQPSNVKQAVFEESTAISIKEEISNDSNGTEEIISTTEIDTKTESNGYSSTVIVGEETATTDIDNKTLNDTENNTAEENNASTEVSEDSEVFSEENSEEINELTSQRTETFARGYSDETIVSNEETVTAFTENSEGILTTIKDYLIEISGEENPLHNNSTEKENEDTDKQPPNEKQAVFEESTAISIKEEINNDSNATDEIISTTEIDTKTESNGYSLTVIEDATGGSDYVTVRNNFVTTDKFAVTTQVIEEVTIDTPSSSIYKSDSRLLLTESNTENTNFTDKDDYEVNKIVSTSHRTFSVSDKDDNVPENMSTVSPINTDNVYVETGKENTERISIVTTTVLSVGDGSDGFESDTINIIDIVNNDFTKLINDTSVENDSFSMGDSLEDYSDISSNEDITTETDEEDLNISSNEVLDTTVSSLWSTFGTGSLGISVDGEDNGVNLSSIENATAITLRGFVPYIHANVFGNHLNVSIKIETEDTSFYIPSSAYVDGFSNESIINITWPSTNKLINNSLSLTLKENLEFYTIESIELSLQQGGDTWKHIQENDTFGETDLEIEFMGGRVIFSNLDFLRIVDGNTEILSNDIELVPSAIRIDTKEIGIAMGCVIAALFVCATVYFIVARSRKRVVHIESLTKHDIPV